LPSESAAGTRREIVIGDGDVTPYLLDAPNNVLDAANSSPLCPELLELLPSSH
jgi:hypothetical protein